MSLDYYPKVKNGPCALASDGENLYVNYWHSGVVNLDSGVVDPGPATRDSGRSHDHASISTSTTAHLDRRLRRTGRLRRGPGNGNRQRARSETATASPSRPSPAPPATSMSAMPPTNTVKVYRPGEKPGRPGPGDRRRRDRRGALRLARPTPAWRSNRATGDLFVVDDVQPGFRTLAGVGRRVQRRRHLPRPARTRNDRRRTDRDRRRRIRDGQAYGQIYVTSGNGSNLVIPPEVGPPGSEQGQLFAFGPAGPGQSIEVTTSGPGQGSVTSNPAGIACPGACKAELNSGAVVNLTATPASGSAFAGWSGACSGTGACQVDAQLGNDRRRRIHPGAGPGGRQPRPQRGKGLGRPERPSPPRAPAP